MARATPLVNSLQSMGPPIQFISTDEDGIVTYDGSGFQILYFPRTHFDLDICIEQLKPFYIQNELTANKALVRYKADKSKWEAEYTDQDPITGALKTITYPVIILEYDVMTNSYFEKTYWQ